MARESKAVFKMAGYSYPGTGPMTKKAGPEKKEVDVDEIDPFDEDAVVEKPKWYNVAEKLKVIKMNKKARKSGPK